MACKKDTETSGAITWTTVLKTDFAATTRDIEFSSVEALTIPLLDPAKDYVLVTRYATDGNTSDIVVIYEDTATITTVEWCPFSVEVRDSTSKLC